MAACETSIVINFRFLIVFSPQKSDFNARCVIYFWRHWIKVVYLWEYCNSSSLKKDWLCAPLVGSLFKLHKIL